MVAPCFQEAFSQTSALIKARLVHRHAVDHRIWPSKVNVFENARRVGGVFRAVPTEQMAGGADEDRLARSDVANNIKAQCRNGHRFAAYDVLIAFVGGPFSEDKWPNSVRVSEGEEPVSRNDRNAGVTATNTGVDGRDRSKNCVDVDVWRPFNAQGVGSMPQFNR